MATKAAILAAIGGGSLVGAEDLADAISFTPATDCGALTHSAIGVTSNLTLGNMTALNNASNATQLADEINVNVTPPIRNALKALAENVNEIRAAIITMGGMSGS